ncbi:ATP-binding protein [Mycolicibacterium pulveris]|uniref:ATP-binding protein n=1 Tax=Mycolicibacterium pulveris TaxID=36813 RepID=UPI003CF82A17
MDIDAQRRLADPLRFEVPATADQLELIRRRLSAWLEPLEVSRVTAADIVLAVNEACSNCIEHAYRGVEPGVIEIEASVQPDSEGRRIAVCIADFGTWRTPPTEPTTRGRGLSIMAAIGDDVDLERTSVGTTVRINFALDGVADELQRPGSRTT